MTASIANAATAVHHTSTDDTSWDGPAAVAGMPNDAVALRYCHAYVDGNGKPEVKGSYSFPHHLSDGGSANMAACRNGLARLSGSSVPVADRPGVERHLRAHLTDGGSDEPEDYHPHGIGGMAMSAGRSWFQIVNAADGTPAQVYIYDVIGGGFFGGGISALDFVTELNAIKASAIDLHINSPGGDVFDAIAIYNALRRHPASVTSWVDGLAASAASFIAQAGNTVLIERNAQFMVHDARGGCWGNAADMQEMVDLLNKASDNIADVYAQRTGVDQATWRDVMREEAWYSSSEAVLAGLADSVADAPTTVDDRLTGYSRFDLKALGARYASRQEAPDPPAPSCRQTGPAQSTVVDGPVSPAPGITVTPGLGVAVTYLPVRPLARIVTDTVLDQSATHDLSAFEQAIVDAVRTGLAAGTVRTVPAPSVAEQITEPAFDPAAFRVAVKAGISARR